MKIAVFGTTLHAGVMAALLAEYGNQIYWCTSVTCEENISVLSLSLIHISEPTRHFKRSRMPSSA